jgi:type III secretion system YscQ/HrcQ family protein
MLDSLVLPGFTVPQVEATDRLRHLLRMSKLVPQSLATPITDFRDSEPRTFDRPVQFELETRSGRVRATLERDCIETALDQCIPGWRDEDSAVLPFEWCALFVFDQLAVDTPLADAELQVLPAESNLPTGEANGPTIFGTFAFSKARWLLSVTILDLDPACLPAATGQPSASRRSRLPVSVVASVGSLSFRIDELRGLSPGDVVLLGQAGSPGLPARIHINDAVSWNGMLDDRAVFTVTDLCNEEIQMKMRDTQADLQEIQDATAAVPDDPEDTIDDLPMHLEVLFRRKTMPLSAIAALRPGSFVDLGIDLAGPVVLKLNESVFGTGQLVRIGDQIGVQIERWKTGSRQGSE